jgi:hypothetical protein
MLTFLDETVTALIQELALYPTAIVGLYLDAIPI